MVDIRQATRKEVRNSLEGRRALSDILAQAAVVVRFFFWRAFKKIMVIKSPSIGSDLSARPEKMGWARVYSRPTVLTGECVRTAQPGASA